jgi:hypothetical protein
LEAEARTEVRQRRSHILFGKQMAHALLGHGAMGGTILGSERIIRPTVRSAIQPIVGAADAAPAPKTQYMTTV